MADVFIPCKCGHDVSEHCVYRYKVHPGGFILDEHLACQICAGSGYECWDWESPSKGAELMASICPTCAASWRGDLNEGDYALCACGQAALQLGGRLVAVDGDVTAYVTALRDGGVRIPEAGR